MSPSTRSLLAALVVAVSACGPLAGDPAAAPSPTADARLEAIRESRALVAEPAVALREAAQVLRNRVEALRTELATGDAAARAGELLDGPVADAEAAVAAVRELTLGGGSDAAEAAAALADAADAVDRAVAAVAPERDEVAELAALDEQLLGLTRAWDEPGSRRQQLERFDELAGEADELADELDARTPLHDCSTAFARRAGIARHVATVTRELRDHVARYEGRAFDERRQELADDPLGTDGTRPGERDAEELAGCWVDAAEVAAAAAAVDEALARLEQALNPSDLSPSSPGADG